MSNRLLAVPSSAATSNAAAGTTTINDSTGSNSGNSKPRALSNASSTSTIHSLLTAPRGMSNDDAVVQASLRSRRRVIIGRGSGGILVVRLGRFIIKRASRSTPMMCRMRIRKEADLLLHVLQKLPRETCIFFDEDGGSDNRSGANGGTAAPVTGEAKSGAGKESRVVDGISHPNIVRAVCAGLVDHDPDMPYLAMLVPSFPPASSTASSAKSSVKSSVGTRSAAMGRWDKVKIRDLQSMLERMQEQLESWRDRQQPDENPNELAGEKKDDTVAPARALSPLHITHIALGLARALCFCHEHGILHGDVKSDNIIVGDFSPDNLAACTVQLIDFGCAMNLSHASSSSSAITSGDGGRQSVEQGQPKYEGAWWWRPPEARLRKPSWVVGGSATSSDRSSTPSSSKCRDDASTSSGRPLHDGGVITFAADCWAFGCVLYGMLTLSLPFSDVEDEEDLVGSSHSPGVVSLPDRYRLLVDLYIRCTALDPAERPTACAIVTILESFMAQSPSAEPARGT